MIYSDAVVSTKTFANILHAYIDKMELGLVPYLKINLHGALKCTCYMRTLGTLNTYLPNLSANDIAKCP